VFVITASLKIKCCGIQRTKKIRRCHTGKHASKLETSFYDFIAIPESSSSASILENSEKFVKNFMNMKKQSK